MAATIPIDALILLCVTLNFSLLLHFSIVEANNNGFSLELIHRDSPLSPLYNSTETDSERFRRATHRSLSRINYFGSSSLSPTSIESTIVPGGYEFLVKLTIGTPPIEILVIADTGSDLTWTQCKPCERCYFQNATMFDSLQSLTYAEFFCDSDQCLSLPKSACGTNGACEYQYSYGDQSFTNGALATETFIFNSPNGGQVPIGDLVFGCGHNNGGSFNSYGSGIVGLGGGSLSFISQLAYETDGKFSYCFAPNFQTWSSKLNFGQRAVVVGGISTPLVPKAPDTFYYLTLEGMSVKGKRLNVGAISEGNIFIDSGTTVTAIQDNMYTELESAVKEAIDLEPVKDSFGPYRLCYTGEPKIPDITFHFRGADIVLKPLNTFMEILDDLVCFIIFPSQGLSVLGNQAQINFQVEYDLNEKKVSFAPVDCTTR